MLDLVSKVYFSALGVFSWQYAEEKRHGEAWGHWSAATWSELWLWSGKRSWYVLSPLSLEVFRSGSVLSKSLIQILIWEGGRNTHLSPSTPFPPLHFLPKEPGCCMDASESTSIFSLLSHCSYRSKGVRPIIYVTRPHTSLHWTLCSR